MCGSRLWVPSTPYLKTVREKRLHLFFKSVRVHTIRNENYHFPSLLHLLCHFIGLNQSCSIQEWRSVHWQGESQFLDIESLLTTQFQKPVVEYRLHRSEVPEARSIWEAFEKNPQEEFKKVESGMPLVWVTEWVHAVDGLSSRPRAEYWQLILGRAIDKRYKYCAILWDAQMKKKRLVYFALNDGLESKVVRSITVVIPGKLRPFNSKIDVGLPRRTR